jgi:dTDP-4-amino-4,6-dideoxygalactose transaminase
MKRRCRLVSQTNTRQVPYYRPFIESDEIEAVSECLRNGWLTTGPRVAEFEELFSKQSGIKHAIALNSCTAGLHLALVALGVGPGDEIIMPSMTFVAGAQCALHVGAVPVFADIDEHSLCLTPETIGPLITKRTKVIMPMQFGGAPLDINSLNALAESRGILVLEDAAHAAGTLDRRGRWAGAASTCAAYSFYATKNITTGEGGMLVTNDDHLAEQVRILALHGMDKDAWCRYSFGSKYGYDVVATGFKYNMSDLAAAIGIVQLGKLEQLQAKRDIIADFYERELGDLNGLRLVAKRPTVGRHSWCVYSVLIDERTIGKSRDEVFASLLQQGVGASVHFIPTHQFSAFRNRAHAPLPITEEVARQLLSLPLYPGMELDDASFVVGALKNCIPSANASRVRSSLPRASD